MDQIYSFYISLGLELIGLCLSALILREFKIANRKEPCKISEKWLKTLVEKIDKVIISDKLIEK